MDCAAAGGGAAASVGAKAAADDDTAAPAPDANGGETDGGADTVSHCRILKARHLVFDRGRKIKPVSDFCV